MENGENPLYPGPLGEINSRLQEAEGRIDTLKRHVEDMAIQFDQFGQKLDELGKAFERLDGVQEIMDKTLSGLLSQQDNRRTCGNCGRLAPGGAAAKNCGWCGAALFL